MIIEDQTNLDTIHADQFKTKILDTIIQNISTPVDMIDAHMWKVSKDTKHK